MTYDIDEQLKAQQNRGGVIQDNKIRILTGLYKFPAMDEKGEKLCSALALNNDDLQQIQKRRYEFLKRRINNGEYTVE